MTGKGNGYVDVELPLGLAVEPPSDDTTDSTSAIPEPQDAA